MTEEEKYKLIADLSEIVAELGWCIAIAGREEDDTVAGLIIGTEDYIEAIVGDEAQVEIISADIRKNGDPTMH